MGAIMPLSSEVRNFTHLKKHHPRRSRRVDAADSGPFFKQQAQH